MAYKVLEIEVSNVGLGDIEFKTPFAFHRIPVTYNGKPLKIQIKCNASLFKNKEADKVCANTKNARPW